MVPDGGRRYMGQIAGFQETSRRGGMTGGGLGLAVLMVKGSPVLSTERSGA